MDWDEEKRALGNKETRGICVRAGVCTLGQVWLFTLLGLCAGVCAPKLLAGPADAVNVSGQGESTGPATEDRAEKTQQRPTGEYRLNRERYEKAVALSRAEYRLYFFSVAWGFAALLLVLWLKVVARLRDFAEARGGDSRWLQAGIFVPALLGLLALLHLPLRGYGHTLAVRYELSVQGWGSWLWDWTKGEFLSIGLAIVVARLLLAVIRWKPRTWWLYFWMAAVPLALFLFFISPWFVDPLFNKFVPLQQKHPELVESIGKLTKRAGVPIPAERMFLMEASAKTNALNAYVTGIGASKRVVIWDTTIAKTKPDELLVIVGHELGHYVLGHLGIGFAAYLVGLLLGLYVTYHSLQWMLKRWGSPWGVRGQEDWAALAALLLIMNVLEFVSMPIGNAFSRMQEHAADVYGLEVVHGLVPNSQEAGARAEQVLGEADLADPKPPRFIVLWLYSHPPQAERQQFAYTYDPWSKGEAPKYVK
ncbi:MAG TPA: M48 family metallopeptidase [Verrucomicrobiae bacterium]|nr:M48 family metallopeptidase [Verrucomicrobiae bacterium]